jgi:hypothetical protein
MEARRRRKTNGKEADGQGLVRSRRQFLSRFVLGAAGAVAAALAVPLAGYFLYPTVGRKKQETGIPLIATADIPPGTPIFVKYQENVEDGWVKGTETMGAWAVTIDGKTFAVFSTP